MGKPKPCMYTQPYMQVAKFYISKLLNSTFKLLIQTTKHALCTCIQMTGRIHYYVFLNFIGQKFNKKALANEDHTHKRYFIMMLTKPPCICKNIMESNK